MILSCVTAVYDAVSSGNAENLRRCIESVSQISVSHEHLIYDGGSKDGTVEFLQRLDAEYGHCFKWVSDSDHGIYEALNKGVRDAQGQWFYVLGCDDWISNPAVMTRALENGERFDVLASPVVYSNGTIWHPAKKVVLAAMPCSHQGLMVRTSVMRELGGFSTDYRMAADFDLMQRLAFAGYDMMESYEPYATFGQGGFSMNEEVVRSENATLLKRRFDLAANEIDALWPKRVLPLHAIRPHLFARYRWLRSAARYQLMRLIAFQMGLICDDGRPHFKEVS